MDEITFLGVSRTFDGWMLVLPSNRFRRIRWKIAGCVVLPILLAHSVIDYLLRLPLQTCFVNFDLSILCKYLHFFKNPITKRGKLVAGLLVAGFD